MFHDDIRSAPGVVLRNDGRGRRHHGGRDLPHAGDRRRAASVSGTGPAGLGDRRDCGAHRRVLLRRAGSPPPARGWWVRLSARDVRRFTGVSVRLDAGVGHCDRGDCRRCRHIRRLHARVVRPAAPFFHAACRGRDRVPYRHQLRRRTSRGDHAEHFHAPQAGSARGVDRCRDLCCVTRRAFTRLTRAVDLRHRSRIGPDPLHLRWLAADELHRRRDR